MVEGKLAKALKSFYKGSEACVRIGIKIKGEFIRGATSSVEDPPRRNEVGGKLFCRAR